MFVGASLETFLTIITEMENEGTKDKVHHFLSKNQPI
jgi:hypothetical protein